MAYEPTKDPREDRLPKWARDLLWQQRIVIERQQQALDEIRGADPRPPIAVRDPFGESVPVAWHYLDSIRFRLRDSGEEWVDVRRAHEGEIEIFAEHTIHIRIQSSNVIHISVE